MARTLVASLRPTGSFAFGCGARCFLQTSRASAAYDASATFIRRELRVLRLLGDGSQDSDNIDFPVHPDWQDDFRQGFFTWLAQSSRSWDICQFRTACDLTGRKLLAVPLGIRRLDSLRFHSRANGY
jgi:hypothetical protein